MYLVMIVDYNTSFLTFLPSACLPLWNFLFLGLLVVYTFALPNIYFCPPCLIRVIPVFVFVHCVLLPDIYADAQIKSQIRYYDRKCRTFGSTRLYA